MFEKHQLVRFQKMTIFEIANADVKILLKCLGVFCRAQLALQVCPKSYFTIFNCRREIWQFAILSKKMQKNKFGKNHICSIRYDKPGYAKSSPKHCVISLY